MAETHGTRVTCRPFALTVRRMMILVGYFGLMSAAVAYVGRRPGTGPDDTARVALLLSPWLMAGLVAAFERPGPLKNWAVVGLLFLFNPALAVAFDMAVVRVFYQSGGVPRLHAAMAFNTMIAAATVLFYRRMAPTPCPSCGQGTLIPLVRPTGQSARLNNTRWCASCGKLYWRDAAGAWRVERRVTWVDAPAPDAASADLESPTPAEPRLLGTHAHPWAAPPPLR